MTHRDEQSAKEQAVSIARQFVETYQLMGSYYVIPATSTEQARALVLLVVLTEEASSIMRENHLLIMPDGEDILCFHDTELPEVMKALVPKDLYAEVEFNLSNSDTPVQALAALQAAYSKLYENQYLH